MTGRATRRLRTCNRRGSLDNTGKKKLKIIFFTPDRAKGFNGGNRVHVYTRDNNIESRPIAGATAAVGT